jgi:hypothetical protein
LASTNSCLQPGWSHPLLLLLLVLLAVPQQGARNAASQARLHNSSSSKAGRCCCHPNGNMWKQQQQQLVTASVDLLQQVAVSSLRLEAGWSQLLTAPSRSTLLPPQLLQQSLPSRSQAQGSSAV